MKEDIVQKEGLANRERDRREGILTGGSLVDLSQRMIDIIRNKKSQAKSK